MAVSSKFTQKSLFGGGSNKSNTPKIDTSYGANLGGGQQNNIVNLPTLSGGGNSGGLTAANENVLKKTLGNTPTVTIPQNLTYQNNLKNMTGIIGQGGASGGVTDEGVIVGNPNVEKMPTINSTTASGSKPQTSPMTYWQQLAAAAQQQTPTESTPDTSGGTGAAGSTGATGGSTTGSGEVDTYEEFLLKQEGFYKEQLDKLNAQIEQNKQNALQQAESERERAVIDARSSYEQNKATYGANAEQLAAMGLSGSGYSDYLNQQAYATQRAETQNANAQAEATKLAAEQQANSDKLNAELSYAENMQGNAEKLAQYQQQKAEEAKAEEEQKKQYYAEDTHDPIISREVFRKAQELLKRKSERHGHQNNGQYPFTSLIVCDECGTNFCRRIAKNQRVLWTCRKHFKGKHLCSMESLNETEIQRYFLTLYKKLAENRQEILGSYLRQLEELKDKDFMAHPDAMELNRQIAGLLEQNHTLHRLRAKECIDSAFFIAQSNELGQKISNLKAELKQYRDLNEYADFIDNTRLILTILDSPMPVFSASVFRNIVSRITVTHETLRFQLVNGLELEEERISGG